MFINMALRFRGNLWSDEETETLISIWGRKSIQDELKYAVRNEAVFIRIADELKKRTYDRTPQQCRCKVKSLKAEYRAGLDSLQKNGGLGTNSRFFHLLDKVLGRQSGTKKVSQTVSHDGSSVVAVLELPNQDGSGPTIVSEEFVVDSQDSDEDNDTSAVVNGTSSSIESCPVPIKVEYDPDDCETEAALEADEPESPEFTEPEPSVNLFNEKSSRKRKKSTVKQIEDILNRVLDNSINKFIAFEQAMDKQAREETNSFRSKLLAIERRKLEETSTQTLQNERIISLMEALVSQRH